MSEPKKYLIRFEEPRFYHYIWFQDGEVWWEYATNSREARKWRSVEAPTSKWCRDAERDLPPEIYAQALLLLREQCQ